MTTTAPAILQLLWGLGLLSCLIEGHRSRGGGLPPAYIAVKSGGESAPVGASLQDSARTTMAASKRVAVIGAGAAGLAASRRLREAGLSVKVLEKSPYVGGVWKYTPAGVVYNSLVTNLPKEIMQFVDFPFNPELPSFTKHRDVQAYLESYAETHDLLPLVTFNATVTSVCPVLSDSDGVLSSTIDFTVFKQDGDHPLCDDCDWDVTYSTTPDSAPVTERFEAVVVANGHFDVPSSPSLPHAERFKGQVVHSRYYDSPKDYEGKVVVCIGYKSSGTDVAREVATVAKEVHVVDRSMDPQASMEQHGNIFRRPQISSFLEDGLSVEFAGGSVLSSVDTVLYCTGYEYDLPFLSPSLIRGEERAVHPVYKHLFHAYWPSLSLMGLLHSVVPFPMFDLQAQYIACQLAGTTHLPSREQRFAWIEGEKEMMRQRGQRMRDWHYLGAKQWAYDRDLAEAAGCFTERLDRVLTLHQQVYEDVQKQRPPYPGGPDEYRRRQYKLDYDRMTWSVVADNM